MLLYRDTTETDVTVGTSRVTAPPRTAANAPGASPASSSACGGPDWRAASEPMQYTKIAVGDRARDSEADYDEEDESAVCSSPRICAPSSLDSASSSLTEEKEALVERTGAAAAGDPADRLSNFFTSGMFLRLTILVAVTMQNTSYALVRRYSRGHLKERYSTSSALLVMELAKLLLSMWMVVFSGHASDVPSGNAISKYVWLIGHSWKMMVPAVICKSQAPTEPAGWTSTSACFRSAAALTLARLL